MWAGYDHEHLSEFAWLYGVYGNCLHRLYKSYLLHMYRMKGVSYSIDALLAHAFPVTVT